MTNIIAITPVIHENFLKHFYEVFIYPPWLGPTDYHSNKLESRCLMGYTLYLDPFFLRFSLCSLVVDI